MFRKLLLALAIAVFPIAGAHALGLGGITLESRLNEPLNAEIELRSVEPGDLEKLRVSLASNEEFEQAGLDRPFLLASLNFETVQRGDETVVKVTTRESFREPFLSFLLKVEWPNGRLLREYTLLLDPPVVTRQAAPAVQAPAAQAAPQMAPATPVTPSAPMRAAPTPTPRAAPAPRVSSVGADEYRIRRGDNLYTIARQTMAGTDVSSQQAMLAFLRSNPEAFINGNINLIKEGYVLRVPTAQEALTVGQAEAVAEVRRQMAEWRTYRQARVSTPAEPGPAVAAAPQARLEVVAPEGGEGAAAGEPMAEGISPEVETMQTELALATEAAEARRLENEELRGQVAELEEKLAEMQRLVTIKVDELAALQARLKEAGAAAEEVAPTEPETQMAEAAPGEETTTQTPTEGESAAEAEQPTMAEKPEETAPPTEEAAPTEAEPTKPEMAAEAETQPEPQTTPPASEPVPQTSFQPPAPTPAGFLEDLLGPDIANDPVMLGGIGGGILLLILLVVMMVRRRGAGAEAAAVPEMATAMEEGIEELAEVEEVDETPSFLDTADDMEVTAFDEPEEAEQPAAAATGGVDQVIAEADVYLAYGRYQQAEELIKGAIDENPGRIDLQSKLLEVHFATRDRDSFEALAQELHSSLESTGGAEWDKYMLMGKDLCPDNPLFAGAETVAASADDSGVPPGALDTGIEFDPFADSTPVETEVTGSEIEEPSESDLSQALEFDLGEEEEEFSAELDTTGAETVVEPSAEEEEEGGLDFDFDFGESSEEGMDLEGTLPLGTEVEPEESEEPEEEGIDLALDALEETGAGVEADDLNLDFDIGSDETPTTELEEEDFDLALSTIQTEADAIEKAIEEEATAQEPEAETEAPVEVDSEPSMVDGNASSMMDERDFSIEWDITGMGLEAPEEEGSPEAAAEAGDEAAEDQDLESTAILDFTSVPLDEESSTAEDADMVATKLDLAKAYIDMGDSDGARNILDEVAKEGNESQRQEAETLLGQLT